MDVLNQIQKTIEDHGLITANDGVIVAVSGGPDSVALLIVLHQLVQLKKLECKLMAVHINHQFRGAESDGEEQFVLRLAARLHIPAVSTKINVPAFMAESGLGTQEAARVKRYEFLKSVAMERGYTKIALGHHADDQVETVLHHVIRGTGISGLAGMPMRRTESSVELIRPMLHVGKADILAFCEDHHVAYRTDSSNLKTAYTRNHIRLNFIPTIERVYPDVKQSVLRLADIARVDDDYIQQQTIAWVKGHVDRNSSGFSFKLHDWKGLHAALQRRSIKLILNYLFEKQPGLMSASQVDFRLVEFVRKSLLNERSTMKIQINRFITLLKEYDYVQWLYASLEHPRNETIQYEYTIDAREQTLDIPEAGVRLVINLASKSELLLNPSLAQGQDAAIFDADELKWPLMIRNRRAGDRMELLGLNGSKKVKDIFIDSKTAPSLRWLRPILADADQQLLWIPGLRRSRHALVGEQTSKVLRIEAKMNP